MMSSKSDIKKVVDSLCTKQMEYICIWPKRENIPKYCRELDIAVNEDFAIWEMELAE